jgi:hypothetical protein
MAREDRDGSEVEMEFMAISPGFFLGGSSGKAGKGELTLPDSR